MGKFFKYIAGLIAKGYHAMKRKQHYQKLRRQSRMELRAMYKSMTQKAKDGERLAYPKSLETFEIIKAQARRSDSEILFAPVSGEFVIKVGEENYIIMTAQKASVINGVYHYDVRMPGDASWYLAKYLKRIVERRRRKIINEIESRVGSSLEKILEEAKQPEIAPKSGIEDEEDRTPSILEE